MTIGEVISEGKGKRTGRRILATEPQFLVEVSFEESTKLLGVEGMNIGTYSSSNKPDGTIYGQGEGVFASMDGEFVTWHAIGIGHFSAGGAVSYKGAISFRTTAAKLARINGIAGALEFEVTPDGSTTSKICELK
jgi:hypothetical protein